MKLTYSKDTIRTQKDAQAKAAEYSQKYGVRFDVYSTGQGWVFSPVITKETGIDVDAGDMLMLYLVSNEYYGYAKLATLSGMSLKKVMEGANALIARKVVVVTVNRMGNNAGIRLMTEKEREHVRANMTEKEREKARKAGGWLI